MISRRLDTFGGRLRFELERSGITQAMLAESLDTYRPNVSQWISGRHKPNLAQLEKILLALPHADARWLLIGVRG